MKKVGIITQHRVVNYGSMLQTYALQEKIEELGYKCEVIDYYPERFTPVGMLKRIKTKSIKLEKSLALRTIARMVIIPSYFIRFKMFFDFLKKRINLSRKTFHTLEELQSYNFKYDIFCTGSDQVWNYGWNEKIEYPYFLSFAPDKSPKISYASSFGKATLLDCEIDETKKLLSRYNHISVRELSGVDIINKLGIEGSTNVLDPTLLLTGNEWRKIASGKYKKDKYILVYNLNRNKKIDNYAKTLAKKTGLKVRYISYQIHEFYKNGKMFCNSKVEDFLSLIDNAQYVITDSFHATAFSLIFNKEFVIVYPGKYSTRLQSILEILGLTNRVAKDENDMSVIENIINYETVNAILNEERSRSIEWLRKALESEEIPK